MRRHLLLLASYLLAVAAPLATAVGTNLEYEFALIAAAAVLVLVPLVAVFQPVGWAPRDEEGRFGPSVPWELFWTFLVAPAVAGGAAFLMFWIGKCPCSRPGFGFWMAVLFLPALILAHALHYAILRARLSGVSRKLGGLALALILLGAAGITGWQLWVNPQKRIVSLFLGFLHGPIYDDWIAFDQGILLLRVAQLLLATALLLATWWRGQKSVLLAVVVLAAGWGAAGHFAQEFPSAATGVAALSERLGGTLEGQGFTLHFYQSKPGQKPTLAVQRLFRDTAFHVQELSALFKEPRLPHVQVYVYPSEDKKKLWFGGGSTDVTDVYTPSVHVTQGSWPHPTLRHELVHALASGFAYHGLGFHPNMAFTEGLAVALAPSERTLSLDDGTASLIASKRMPKLEDLFSPAFWKVSGGRAYTTAGSLINFLIAKHGVQGVKALYSGKSWSDAFNESQEDLLREWQETIQKGYDKDRNALFTEALFRYPGVFDDECPHSKADLARSRTESLWVRVRQPVGWNPDRDYLPWLLRIDPNDEEIRLREWRRDVRKAAMDRSEGRLTTWRETLAAARKAPPEALEDVELALLESDVDRAAGDGAASRKLVDELAAVGKSKFFGESIRREIEARTAIERLYDDASAQAWRRYLAGWAKSIPEKREGEPWLATYLRLRNGQIDQGGAPSLKKALETPVDPAMSTSFHVEWYRLLANKLMREGAFADAAFAYRKAAEVTPTAARDLFQEQARRADFYVAQGPLAPEEPAPEDPSSH